eukprot:8056698-Pyramimonas_sp.AAC.2
MLRFHVRPGLDSAIRYSPLSWMVSRKRGFLPHVSYKSQPPAVAGSHCEGSAMLCVSRKAASTMSVLL